MSLFKKMFGNKSATQSDCDTLSRKEVAAAGDRRFYKENLAKPSFWRALRFSCDGHGKRLIPNMPQDGRISQDAVTSTLCTGRARS